MASSSLLNGVIWGDTEIVIFWSCSLSSHKVLTT